MTPEQADNLKPGDRIALSTGSRTTGTVEHRDPYSVWIRWDSGALTGYHRSAMPHIISDPEGKKKKEE